MERPGIDDGIRLRLGVTSEEYYQIRRCGIEIIKCNPAPPDAGFNLTIVLPPIARDIYDMWLKHSKASGTTFASMEFPEFLSKVYQDGRDK
jgi:hypothetical protein